MIGENTVFIGGRWNAAHGGTIELVDPSTEQTFAAARMADEHDVDRAVAAARSAFDSGGWPDLPRQTRIELILAMADHLEANAGPAADLLLQEIGLPVAFSRGNLVGAAYMFRYYAGTASSYPWTERRVGVSGVSVEINRLPVGVVAAIVPWNAPISLAASKLAPALLAGCTAVVKASPLNALSIRCLGDAALAVGMPPGVVNVVAAEAAASERLVAHPGVDKIAFTGSDATGRRIAAVASQTLKRVTLELGGKSAGIVLSDASIERLVATVPSSFTLNNGEACAALTRLLVPREREDEIIEALAGAVSKLPVGDPRDPSIAVGPLATAAHHRQVMDHLTEARLDGEIVCGGDRPDHLRSGYYLNPTIVRGVAVDSTIATTELFAPVLTVLTYDSVDEAVHIANSTAYGLSGAVFGSDEVEVRDVARRIRSGSVHLNNGLTVDIAVPFGGFKASGYGREFGPEAVDAYVELQAVFLDGEPYSRGGGR